MQALEACPQWWTTILGLPTNWWKSAWLSDGWRVLTGLRGLRGASLAHWCATLVLAAPLSGLLWKETRARCGTREGFSLAWAVLATHCIERAVARAFVHVSRSRCVARSSNMGFYDHQMPSALDPEARRAALALLARGVMRPHEVAELAGVTLQVMNYWIQHAGVDWERIRRRRNAAAWRKEVKRGPRLVESEPPQVDVRPWD